MREVVSYAPAPKRCEMSPDANPSTKSEEVDGGGTDMAPGDHYVVVRKAMEDAILSVIGTLLLVGLSLVLIWFGMMVAVSAYDTSPLMALAGGFVVLVGLYQAASALGIIPPVTDLL